MTESEHQLRQEVEELRRQLEEHRRLLERQGSLSTEDTNPRGKRPTSLTLTAVAIAALILMAVAFFAGYLPRQKREAVITAEAHQQEQSLPRVSVATVKISSGPHELVLPGNIQPLTEAPILARATGYIKSRLVDIGDQVRAGQLLAEIEAPELDQQVEQAQATLRQTEAGLDQANANRQQGESNLELARVTAQRYGNLAGKGVVSKQENDQYQAQFKAQTANLDALDKAVNAARSLVASAQANLGRLREMQGYKQVKAPFAGVVTVRDVDTGALINAGTTLLFRIAQVDTLRTYVNVPQSNADSIRTGQSAEITVSNLPGRKFVGRVARTANALDPTTRTLLVEVQVPNPRGELLPGMYADVNLNTPMLDPPFVIPGEALVTRSDGPQVAVAGRDGVVHFQKVQISRDYGDRLDITGGVHAGDQVILHPNDFVREGAKVEVAGSQDAAGN